MKQKGFTLIELLAVIVILAIIAVITVPKIADMITSSRQGGAEDSFYGTLKAAELGYTKALQSNTNLKGSTCTITDSKITCTNGVNVEVSGKTPESGILTIDSAGSTIAKALILNGYKCYGDLSTSNPCVKTDVEVASETLIKKVTTSGDGLYKDTYEEGKYIFKGASPNNYLNFNNEMWLIMNVENDGTIQIIKDVSIGKLPFDSRTTTTSGPRLNENNTYCRLWDGIYYGCNAWSKGLGRFSNGNLEGTVNEDSSLNIYLNTTYLNGLSDSSKAYIADHNFYYGSDDDNGTIEQNVESEKKYIAKNKVGLPTPSEYLRVTSNTKCDTIYHSYQTNDCGNDNYIYLSVKKEGIKAIWTLNPRLNHVTHIFDIDNNTYPGGLPATSSSTDIVSVRPVMHLKANLQLTGSGTQSDPYKIK